MPESDNEFTCYLYHPVLSKEVIIDKKDMMGHSSIRYQLNHIELNEIFFDSPCESLNN